MRDAPAGGVRPSMRNKLAVGHDVKLASCWSYNLFVHFLFLFHKSFQNKKKEDTLPTCTAILYQTE